MDKLLGKKLHHFRGYELPKILEQESLHFPERITRDMILWQCITDKIIQDTIQMEASLLSSHLKAKKLRRLDPVEENAIRYAGGYVIRKILTIYRKKEMYGPCLDSLMAMLLEDAGDDIQQKSFLQYTSMWLDKTDRGGLYHISDLCFELFTEIELGTYELLNGNFLHKKKVTLEEIELTVFRDSDVRRIWAYCSLSTDPEESEDILRNIVHQWAIIRGTSLNGRFKKIER